jgi:hypothetical protein
VRFGDDVALAPLEILNGPLVGLCSFSGSKCSEITPASSFGVLLARIQTIFSGLQFPNHNASPCRQVVRQNEPALGREEQQVCILPFPAVGPGAMLLSATVGYFREFRIPLEASPLLQILATPLSAHKSHKRASGPVPAHHLPAHSLLALVLAVQSETLLIERVFPGLDVSLNLPFPRDCALGCYWTSVSLSR